MKTTATLQPVDRVLATLSIVRKEGEHLIYSYRRVFGRLGQSAPVIEALGHFD